MAYFTPRDLAALQYEFMQKVHQCSHEVPCTACCWPWIGAHGQGGYGRLMIHTKRYGAHIIAVELDHGAMLLNNRVFYVTHTCDNPPCCNPAHLAIGTAYDNTHDAHMKGLVPSRKGISIPRRLQFS